MTLLSRRLHGDELLCEHNYALAYAVSIDRELDESGGHIPSCSGDIRVEFREDADNDFHIWSGESFYLAEGELLTMPFTIRWTRVPGQTRLGALHEPLANTLVRVDRRHPGDAGIAMCTSARGGCRCSASGAGDDATHRKGIAIGDRVMVNFWGEELAGKVETVGREMGGVLWVRMEKSGRLLWFHRQSLRLAQAGAPCTLGESVAH